MPPKGNDGEELDPLKVHADASELTKEERRRARDRERKAKDRAAKKAAKSGAKDKAPEAGDAPEGERPPPPLPPELEKEFREAVGAFLEAGAALPFYVMARRKDDVRWLLEEKEVKRNARALEYWAEFRLPQILELLKRYPEFLVAGCFGASALPRLRMGPPAEADRLSFVVAQEKARNDAAQRAREADAEARANGQAA